MTVDALQTALAAEHAALYAYGVLGARTSQSRQPLLFAEVTDAYLTHRAWRDLLTSRLVDQGADPVAAEASYDVAHPPPTTAALRRVAAEVEGACAETYAYVVANTAGADRRWAVEALVRSAVRLCALGEPPGPFPGAPDLA